MEYLLKECDFKKGVCQDKVFFVRNKSQLGLITKNGELYQQLLASEYMRDNPKAKTDKYIPGDIVETLRDKYVYQGSLYEKFDITEDRWYPGKYVFKIILYKKPVEKYFYLSKSTWSDDWYNGIRLSRYDLGYSNKTKYFVTGHMDVNDLDTEINKEFSKDYYKRFYDDPEKCKELFKFRYSKDDIAVTDENKAREYLEFILKKDSYYKNMKYEIIVVEEE